MHRDHGGGLVILRDPVDELADAFRPVGMHDGLIGNGRSLPVIEQLGHVGANQTIPREVRRGRMRVGRPGIGDPLFEAALLQRASEEVADVTRRAAAVHRPAGDDLPGGALPQDGSGWNVALAVAARNSVRRAARDGESLQWEHVDLRAL